MNHQNKSREQLLKELQALEEEHEQLRLSYQDKSYALQQTEVALRESEESNWLLLDLAPIAFFQGNETGDIILANKKASLLTQYSKEELSKMNMRSFFSPSLLNQKPLRYDLLDKGEIITTEREITRKDGSIVAVEMSSRKMPNNTYQSFIRDISEQKQAEAALKESERLYRAIFENTGTSSIIIEEDTTIALANTEWINLSGYSREELEGKMSWTQFVDPEDIERMKEYHYSQRIDSQNAPKKYEARFIRRNGEVRNILNCVSMIPESNRSIASLMDITELKLAEKTLKESEARFKTILETSPDGIAIAALDGIVQFVTPKIISLWGYSSANEVVGRNLFEFVHPSYHDKANHFIAEMFKGNFTGEAEYLMVRKDGSQFFCESNANILSDANNNPIGVLYVNRDITHRKQVEEELIHAKEKAEVSEEKYRLIFENAPLGILHFDNRGRIVSCNENFVKIIGSSLPALIGLDMMTLSDEKIVAAVKESLNGGLGFYDDDYHSNTANKITPVRVLFAPIFSKNNTVIGGVGIVEDVTERRNNEQDLKKQNEEYSALNKELQHSNTELQNAKCKVEENEAFLKSIFENIPNMIFIKHADDLSYFQINKAGEKLLGYTIEQLIGKNDFDFFPREQAEWFRAKDKDVFKQEGLMVIEEEKIDTLYGPKLLYTKKIAVKDKKGNNKYLLGISEDITHRKEIENELIKAKEKAEESDRLKSAFLANMSHEIRTPMNGILGFADLLKQPQLSGEQQYEYINIIEKSGVRMLNIINDIIDIAKIESGETKVVVTETNINDLMNDLLLFFKPEVEIKGLSLISKAALPPESEFLATDREKVYAILMNLMKNAIKFTDQGFVEVGCELKNEVLEFYIKDTGIGIHEERHQAVFERFVQADIADKRAFQGAGLGLAITKAYVEMLGGNIWFTSEAHKGTVFYFTLPYLACALPEWRSKPIVDESTTVLVNHLKVLIVEDDGPSDVLLSLLLGQFHFELLHARSGIEAVEICRSNPDIDLILMDLKMPDMDGYEATLLIRQFNAHVVIIAQSAYALAGDRDKAIKIGCNDYLTKPINHTILKKLISKYFE